MSEKRDFPAGTISIETQTLHQADCLRCGWHTRHFEKEYVVRDLAQKHFKVCPNPHFRNGALMECGCWYYASPGDSAGKTTKTCPVHGPTLMIKANVDEPVAYGEGWWHEHV